MSKFWDENEESEDEGSCQRFTRAMSTWRWGARGRSGAPSFFLGALFFQHTFAALTAAAMQTRSWPRDPRTEMRDRATATTRTHPRRRRPPKTPRSSTLRCVDAPAARQPRGAALTRVQDWDSTSEEKREVKSANQKLVEQLLENVARLGDGTLGSCDVVGDPCR